MIIIPSIFKISNGNIEVKYDNDGVGKVVQHFKFISEDENGLTKKLYTIIYDDKKYGMRDNPIPYFSFS